MDLVEKVIAESREWLPRDKPRIDDLSPVAVLLRRCEHDRVLHDYLLEIGILGALCAAKE